MTVNSFTGYKICFLASFTLIVATPIPDLGGRADAAVPLSPAHSHIRPQVSPMIRTQPASVSKLAQLSNPAIVLEAVPTASKPSNIPVSDWIYQSLRSLIERYGCQTDYLTSRFHRIREANRFEMAAALNACLEHMRGDGSAADEAQSSWQEQFASPADRSIVQVLQTEFQKELAILQGQDNAPVSKPESFIPATFAPSTYIRNVSRTNTSAQPLKSQGFNKPDTALVIDLDIEQPPPLRSTPSNLSSRFSVRDLRQASLTSEIDQPGFNVARLDDFNDPGNRGKFQLNSRRIDAVIPYPHPSEGMQVAYGFPLANSGNPSQPQSLTGQPQLDPSVFHSHFLTARLLPLPLALNFLRAVNDDGEWATLSNPMRVRTTYVAQNSTPIEALESEELGSGDPYQLTAALEYDHVFGRDQHHLVLSLQYTNSVLFDAAQNGLGLNAEVTFGRLGLFGYYGYALTSVNQRSFLANSGEEIDFRTQSWMAGIGVKDLLTPGSWLAISAGQPYRMNLPDSASLGATPPPKTYEAFFKLPMGEHLSVTPGLILTTDSHSPTDQPTIFQGYIRTTISF